MLAFSTFRPRLWTYVHLAGRNRTRSVRLRGVEPDDLDFARGPCGWRN